MKSKIFIGHYQNKYYIFRWLDNDYCSGVEYLNDELKWRYESFYFPSREEAERVLNQYYNLFVGEHI